MEKRVNKITYGIYDFMKYFELIKELVSRDFKKKYYKSMLGILWSVLNPLLNMCIMTIVFSTLFKRNIPNYAVYYLIGSTIFNFNSTATNQSLNSITGNNGLLQKIYLPKYIFCVSTVITNFINMLISLIPLFLVMIVTGVKFTKYSVLFPIVLVYVFIFSMGLSLILSCYAVFFRDMNHLYGVINIIWVYCTPIFYPISIINPNFLFLWELNPIYIYVSIARDLLLYGVMPPASMFIIATVYSLLTLITGIVIFKSKQNRFHLYI